MRPELLAPAKNLDIAIAAINHGADAVYMGASKFGAREAAGNSLADIEQAIKYAHRYRAKIFLTLNTLLFENELEEARKIAIAAYNMGCDALIVQDMAFLEMDLPPIPLHASTQTHNTTPEKVKFLQETGFQRVVLARELSIKQIDEISAATTIELESFIHGALCVCYSGQCYLSHMLTGRSANRGTCAQPCRSAYNLIDGNGQTIIKNKHLLSLKDLNLTQHLQQLAQAGVCSFKIEGRLKDADYVKNVVAHYRKTIDRVFAEHEKCSSGHVYLNFEPNPDKTFSRGFSNYFSSGEQPQNTASLNTPKSLGEKIGVIKSVEEQSITIAKSGANTLCAGDGVCFFDKNETLRGTNINRVEGKQVWLQNMDGVRDGQMLYRNFDIAFQRQLENPNSAKRLIDVDIYLNADEKIVCLTANDEDGNSVTLNIDKENVIANNEVKTLSNIKEQLSKSGNSQFKINQVNISTSQPYFYAISELNAWRRTLLENLEQKREQNYKVKNSTKVKNSVPFPYLNQDFKLNILNKLSKRFYENHKVDKIITGYELEKPKTEVALMTTRYCVLHELGMCKRKSKEKLIEPIFLENNGRKFRLQFDCKNCEMTVVG